jgi:hypothetical protein
LGKGDSNNSANTNSDTNSKINPVADENAAPIAEERVTPVYTKPVELEVMKKDEMDKMGFEPGSLIQVLKRDENGTVLSYRVMKDENDVMEFFGN